MIIGRLIVSYGYRLANAQKLTLNITRPDLTVLSVSTPDVVVIGRDLPVANGYLAAGTFVGYMMEQADFTLSGLYTVRPLYDGPAPPDSTGPFDLTCANSTFYLPRDLSP